MLIYINGFNARLYTQDKNILTNRDANKKYQKIGIAFYELKLVG